MDKETGYYFYNARHYDAGIGRFVTPDTVIPNSGSTQSWNRYSYCTNNPIIYNDPTGHEPVSKMRTLDLSSDDSYVDGRDEPVLPGGGSDGLQFADKLQSNNTDPGTKILKGNNKPQPKEVILQLANKFAQGQNGGMSKLLQSKEFGFTEKQANKFAKNSCVTESLFLALAGKGYAEASEESFKKFIKYGLENKLISENGGLLDGGGKGLAEAYGAKYNKISGEEGYKKYLEMQQKEGEYFMVGNIGVNDRTGKVGPHSSVSYVESKGKDIAIDTGRRANRGVLQKDKEFKPVTKETFRSITLIE